MEATAQRETLATILNQAEDRLYITFGKLPEELRPGAVRQVMDDKKRVEEYAKADPAMARAGQEEIRDYLQEAGAFISKYG